MDNESLMSYCANCVHDEVLQKEIDEKVALLLGGILSNKDDYQKEKAIKVFCEGLRYLENSLLYKVGIHPNQYDLSDYNFMNGYGKKFEEVRRIMSDEIKRQYRHFTIMF